jgi:hypothetical protein
MSVPADRLNQLRPLSGSLPGLNEQRPAAAAAPNAEPAHIAEALLPDTGLRRTEFVTVSNLHQGDELRNQFGRVPLAAEQIRDELGDGLYSLFDFQSPAQTEIENDAQAQAQRQPMSRETMNRLHMPVTVSKDKLKHDYKHQAAVYQELHTMLQDSDAVQAEDSTRSLFQKIKKFVVGEQRDRLSVSVEGRDQPNTDTLTLKLGIDGKEITKEATLHHRNNYTAKSGIGWRKVAYGVGMGALLVGGAAAIVVVGGLLAAVGGGLAIAGGVVMAGKLAIGKHPWWGKTVTGQLQRAEREHARTLADGIAEQVKATMMVDAGKRNVEGEFEARHILQDKEALQNFIRLAKEKNASRLYNDIRDKLLEEASSPLSGDTIKRAKNAAPGWKFWSYLFQGAQGKHANKTVDIYAKELTMGIMRGVNEAYVQSLIGELSDKVSNEAQQTRNKILGQGQGQDEQRGLMTRVTEALQFLNPKNHAERFPIAKPEQHIAALEAMLEGGQVVGPEAGSISRAIAQVRQAEAVLGEQNTRNLTTSLETLKTDLEKHIASLRDVEQLLSKQGEGVASLDAINVKLASLLTDGFESREEAEQATRALDDDITALTARINDINDPDAQRLVKAHAEQLIALLSEVREAISDASKHAVTTASANAAFRNNDLTLESFRSHADSLNTLAAKQMADLDPSGRGALVRDAMRTAQTQRASLVGHCEALKEAAQRANEITTCRDRAVALAVDGKLSEALALETEVADRYNAYQRLTGEWTNAGYTLPLDLQAMDVPQWRREVTAAYLKLEAPTVALAPVLDKLAAGGSTALDTLRSLSADSAPGTVKALLEQLQETLPAADANAGVASQQALNALRALDRALANADGREGVAVAAALHPAQSNVFNTYRALSALNQTSQSVMIELGDALSLVNAVQPDPQRAKSTDPAAEFLLALAQFCDTHPKVLDAAATENLNAIAAQFAQAPDGFAAWGNDAQRITAFDRDQVMQLLQILSGLSSVEDPLRAAISAENETRLARLAVSHTLAAELVPGATSSASAELKNGVQNAALPKPGVDPAALKTTVQRLLDAYVERSTSASTQRLTNDDLEKLATQLATQLRFQGKPTDLIQRIGDHPAVQRLLRRHISAHAELQQASQKQLPPVASDMTSSERLESARTLASFATARDSALQQLSTDGKDTVRARVEARDQLAARFRTSKGAALDERGLARKLRNAQTREAVERFALEERVFGFLKEATGTQATLKEIRIAIEDSGANVENVNANLPLLRQQARDHASAINGYIETGIRARLTAIQELVDSGLYDAIPLDDKEGSWDPKLAYLGTEIVRLQRELDSLGKVAQALDKPAEYDLADVGRMIRDADAVVNANKTDIKLAYIRAQQQETAQALKYFNVRNFSVQTPGWGFLGQLYFRLFNRNEAELQRVASREDARAIADSISLIAQKTSTTDSLKLQSQQLEQAIAELEANKRAMVNDEDKVKSALVLITLERLAESGGDEISDGLRDLIITDWRALLGEKAASHEDLVVQAGKFTNLTSLVVQLKVQHGVVQQIEKEREAIREQQRTIELKGKQLRDEISKAAVEVARKNQAKTLEQAADLGLDEADFITLTSLFGEPAATTIINNWQKATDSRERGHVPEAWARASAVVMSMEAMVIRNSDNLSGAEQKRNKDISRRLIDKLEREFLQDFPQGTAPLDSVIRAGSPAERGHFLYTRGYELSLKASKLDKIESTQQRAIAAAKLRDEIGALEEEVKQSLKDVDLLDGTITDTRLLSKRALQRLGVEAQLYLAIGLRRLARHTEPANGDPSFAARAQYHSYNAGMIRQALESQAGREASAYSPGDVSSYTESLKFLDRELQHWFRKDADKLNANTLGTLRNQAEDALDMAIDEGDVDNREIMRANAQLTSAVIDPSASSEKRGFFKKLFGGGK